MKNEGLQLSILLGVSSFCAGKLLNKVQDLYRDNSLRLWFRIVMLVCMISMSGVLLTIAIIIRTTGDGDFGGAELMVYFGLYCASLIFALIFTEPLDICRKWVLRQCLHSTLRKVSCQRSTSGLEAEGNHDTILEMEAQAGFKSNPIYE